MLYLIFDKDFEGSLMAKAFDEDGLEMGRSRLEIDAKSGETEYFIFTFNKHTDIETKSVITIE